MTKNYNILIQTHPILGSYQVIGPSVELVPKSQLVGGETLGFISNQLIVHLTDVGS